METDKKLDLLLQLVEGNEKKQVEADERTRAEYQDLKRTVESRIPAVEKRVDELGAAFQELNLKVDKLESKMMQAAKVEIGTGSQLKEEQTNGMGGSTQTRPSGMQDPNSTPSAFHFCESFA